MRWPSAIFIAAMALGFVPIPSLATSAAPLITAANVNVAENAGTASIILTKAKASSYSKVTLQTVDGTAKAGIDYTPVNVTVTLGNSVTRYAVPVTILNNATYQGTRSFSVRLTCTRYCSASAPVTVTIADDETPPVPPPPTNSWVSAPLQDGGFARVKNANDSLWPMTGPGSGRPLVNGEIVAVYFNGWGYQADGQPSFAIYALSDGTSGRALMSDLEGVAPVGSPPPLPGDWWVPGLVKAVKTCSDPTSVGGPGVVAGGTYRAAMVSGTHMKLADGVTSVPGVMWEVFGTGDQSYTAHTIVTGDCLVGLAAP